MQTKVVSQLDSQGYFVSATLADESPLEPGVWLIPAGAIDFLPPEVSPGKRYRFSEGNWVEEDVPVVETPEETPVNEAAIPRKVSRYKGRAALYLAGYLESVEALMANPEMDMLLKLAWEDAQEFDRDSPWVQKVAQVLEISEEQLDQLFMLASTIV